MLIVTKLKQSTIRPIIQTNLTRLATHTSCTSHPHIPLRANSHVWCVFLQSTFWSFLRGSLQRVRKPAASARAGSNGSSQAVWSADEQTWHSSPLPGNGAQIQQRQSLRAQDLTHDLTLSSPESSYANHTNVAL